MSADGSLPSAIIPLGDHCEIRLPVFEGPLDLLLHLIRKESIDVYDIPIARITEQYLGYIQLMQDLNVNVAGEFLEMAATLIYIKSRMLLPAEPAADGEMAAEEDPRAELVERLLEYERFKNAAQTLYEREQLESRRVRNLCRCRSSTCWTHSGASSSASRTGRPFPWIGRRSPWPRKSGRSRLLSAGGAA
jgi:hypothetical protein